jgi:hypothetical protein
MLTKKPYGAALGLVEHGHEEVRASYDATALGDCAARSTLHDAVKGGGRLGVAFVVYYERFEVVVDITGQIPPKLIEIHLTGRHRVHRVGVNHQSQQKML